MPSRPGAGAVATARRSARQSTLREANLALVAATVFAAEEPISRAGVSSLTSLTRSTVSRLVDDLVAGGVLDEIAPAAVTGPGRPATPLRPAAGRFGALGLQVNAGYLAARLMDLSGRVLAERVLDDDLIGSGPAPTLRRLGGIARGVLAERPDRLTLVGTGLALPGIVDVAAGHLLSAPNLGWSDVDPTPDLLAGLGPDGDWAAGGRSGAPVGGLHVRVGNEADLAARAFAEPAPGRRGPLSDFVFLSGEVGIGGAIVLDGAAWSGRHGWAGEIGHVCVDPDGPRCRCGSTGCLEQYAGRRAMLAAAGLPADTSPAELAVQARAGHPGAVAAIAEASRALGIALAGVVNVLDIPTIVLSGHLGQVGDLLAPELTQVLGERVLSARWVAPEITVAPEDLAPGATGAALLELHGVIADPARYVD
ncbi:ROK family transcriptional regulator [Intrasporangium oryzae NRRL B-24470]|uniref:ROK family transcriptional regulator n=1 Tax=Intrasporangium oryzae NRRL B-24470 TaxID=1386089 RepID=W9G7T3_9MICO|nr:ROK family transcriptional regulator [Intrasporangium oryzae NRRL B-24470]